MLITRDWLQMLTFKPFDSVMYEGFAGVSSPVPMYAEDGDEFLFILDGDVVELYDEDGSLVERCDSISSLEFA